MVNEDEHVDIDEHIIFDDDTQAKLRRQAQHWRGVTAIADSSLLVKELPPAELSSYSNLHIIAYLPLHPSPPTVSSRITNCDGWPYLMGCLAAMSPHERQPLPSFDYHYVRRPCTLAGMSRHMRWPAVIFHHHILAVRPM